MFDKKESNKELELATRAKDYHAAAHRFKHGVGEAVYNEFDIFNTRYAAMINLKEDASAAEVKRTLSRVKRSAMDVRDALKELGRFTI